MNVILSILVGALVAAGLYLMMRRSITKLLIGLALLAHAGNLAVFVAGGLTRGHAPLISKGKTELDLPYADPLPQALILTAIVIGFGVLAFTITLVCRMYREAGTDDQAELTTSEE